MEPGQFELIGRLLLATVLGALLGAEREVSMKTAGLRTHTLVAAGACLFTITGAYAFDLVGTDRTRVAAQVVTGIGFIGAGGLLRSGFTVSGITTAATLWFAAAIGMAAGFGMYVVAPVSLVLAVAVMLGLAPIRRRMQRARAYPLEIHYRTGHGTLTPLFDEVNAADGAVMSMSMVEESGVRRLTVEIGGVDEDTMVDIVGRLADREEVVKIAPPPGVTA